MTLASDPMRNPAGSKALDTLPTLSAADVPVIAREQMREVDRLMIEEFGIQLLQMMENAGLNLADLVRRYLGEPFHGALPDHDIVIDAVTGYSLEGPPRGVSRDLIAAADGSSAPVISLDVPSGVDVDTGEAPGEAIRATATLTLALPKVGLLQSKARAYVGKLYLADISVPPILYSRFGLSVPPLFAESPLVIINTK